MKTRVKPPANYFGGKAGSYGELIASLLPEHRIYVEPFGGMGGVLFHKQPSAIEVYNDIDKRIYTLFKVLRDPGKSKKLQQLLWLTPFGRENLRESSQVLSAGNEKDEIEIARCVLVVLSMSISGSFTKAGFRNGGGKYNTSLAKLWHGKIKNLSMVTSRIMDLNIECQSAEKIMIRHNEPDTLFYCDPPYVHSTRNLNKARKYVNEYSFEMTDLEHELFLIVAKGLKGKILISGYDNLLYNTMLEGWERLDTSTFSGLAASNTTNLDDGSRTEVLWSNFPLNTQLKIF